MLGKILADGNSISVQLYSSNYRFLYELIQNADDLSYTAARSKGAPPRLTFRITRTQLIVETNEDGFNRANVEAICATGQSSKKASALDDHIGEKGFGFKAVFAVAHTVHVQSGIWSFSFKHRKGDDGLGMVTPLDAAPVELPTCVSTRITLTLSDTTDRGYTKLLEAVAELPMTTIFFLQRLEKITICTVRADSQEERLEIERKRDTLSRRLTIYDGSATVSDTTDTNAYMRFSHTVQNMPEDDRRIGRTRAKVELAFPYDTVTQKPKLSELGQHVFAYLPLQRLPQIQVCES